MSVSSRRLKVHEFAMLKEAQVKAAELPGYKEWVTWMRSTHPYARAVRMALFLGFKVPNKDFYLKMRKLGQFLRTYEQLKDFAKEHKIVVWGPKAPTVTGCIPCGNPVGTHDDRFQAIVLPLHDSFYVDLETHILKGRG